MRGKGAILTPLKTGSHLVQKGTSIFPPLNNSMASNIKGTHPSSFLLHAFTVEITDKAVRRKSLFSFSSFFAFPCEYSGLSIESSPLLKKLLLSFAFEHLYTLLLSTFVNTQISSPYPILSMK